ncbi:MAG: DUF192 domain-containing protein [Candidatus Portnoybacteria bacterium]
MEKILFIILALIITIGSILLLRRSEKDNQVCLKDNCFKVELAQTKEERGQGLMFRESLDSDRGMLFVFEKEGIYSFWMKNTLIPLDIIWINEQKEVVFIKENVQPCGNDCFSINPEKMAKYVLEISGGMTQKIGLSLGDKLEFNIKK